MRAGVASFDALLSRVHGEHRDEPERHLRRSYDSAGPGPWALPRAASVLHGGSMNELPPDHTRHVPDATWQRLKREARAHVHLDGSPAPSGDDDETSSDAALHD